MNSTSEMASFKKTNLSNLALLLVLALNFLSLCREVDMRDAVKEQKMLSHIGELASPCLRVGAKDGVTHS